MQENDKFRVSNTNAKLYYPISLITADEVAMAGAIWNTANNNYYLYNGEYFWTLSPSHFSPKYTHADNWSVDSSGRIIWNITTYLMGARPVINLKPDVTILSGDGTSISPFKIATN